MSEKGLEIGQSAPSFKIRDINDEEINLKELRSKNRGILVFFFRGTW